ncbi:methionyl-tRNA formyltransferase [Hyphomicrobium methylovorum]|uniref:methionyl-tRNA formyltransferase n=1 Tax=Hyphomicrobium methylovorum TaxID=84 RepID=UPI0015E63CDA|nr:methionyl-tRNA formyltransferase [Hyphomicrobium methylovorum]MBA2126666.1 methionyl-tRNA formyltransferase [Hyphomicrobium methylovorum]
MALNIIFMGTPDFSVPVLDAVLEAGHRVVAVYSQPPRPSGRGLAETKSPVHRRAEALGLLVRTPKTFKAEADRAEFAALKADAAVVVAYGLLLPPDILSATRLGCFNVHASKLPRWRGAAPIQRAIMAGDVVTAATVMRMDAGLDTGPICLERDVAISPEMTAGELHDALSVVGATAMVEALALLEADKLGSVPQLSEGVTYAEKIDKSETRIAFDKPARAVIDHIRGLAPRPGAWFELVQGEKRERIKVLSAEAVAGNGTAGELLDAELTIACGSGAIRIRELQRAGKQPMSAADFLRGSRLTPGIRFA